MINRLVVLSDFMINNRAVHWLSTCFITFSSRRREKKGKKVITNFEETIDVFQVVVRKITTWVHWWQQLYWRSVWSLVWPLKLWHCWSVKLSCFPRLLYSWPVLSAWKSSSRNRSTWRTKSSLIHITPRVTLTVPIMDTVIATQVDGQEIFMGRHRFLAKETLTIWPTPLTPNKKDKIEDEKSEKYAGSIIRSVKSIVSFVLSSRS